MEEVKICPLCGGCCGTGDEEKEEPKKVAKKFNSVEDTHLAILLALVPAMTMSLFNLMGLI